MHVLKGIALLSVALVSLSASLALATEPGACSPPTAPLKASHASIFNPQQEQWLGDAEADVVEPELTLQPESASAYVTKIGQRLVAGLPPTSTRYSFQIFESEGLAGFALAGGHIYVSRKLLLDARSEDEVAAMLAHEIGRAYIHHSASLVTLRFEKLLDVRSVTGKADIEDKLERLLNIPPTQASDPKPGDRDKDEMLGDRVALYALIKAGYIPEALTSYLDRSGDSGFTTDSFTELFDFESDPAVRAPQALKVYNELPNSCHNARPQFRTGFKAFEDALREARIDPTLPPSPGLNSIALTPPMNPALLNVRLSPDAKYVLAQDESQIHVLSANPLKLLFSINARDAELAQFTPDSKSVAFAYPGPRVENWDVASKQRAGLLDWVDYDGCGQSSLSPDGVMFACFTVRDEKRWFKITDLSDGEVIYQDTVFPDSSPLKPAPILIWSQDGRYFSYSGEYLDFALDLKTRKPATFLQLGNRIAFVDSNRLVFDCGDGLIESGRQSKRCFAPFPAGDTLDRFSLDSTVWVAPVTRGPHVLVGPFDGAAARVLDPVTGNLGQKFKLETVDLSGETVAQETAAGGLSLGNLDGPAQTAALPVTPIRTFEVAAFSADGHYLAMSDRARGAVWDLTTGNRLKITYPFRTAAFDSRGELEAVQVEQELKPSGDGTIDRETGKVASKFTVGSTVAQFGDVIVGVKPRNSGAIAKGVDLNAIDAGTKAALWTRNFPDGVPRVLPAEGGRILLMMPWASKAREAELRAHKDVLIRTSEEKKKDDDTGLLVEVVNSRTGLAERLILVPADESDSVKAMYVSLFGNLLAVEGNHNNATIYRETDGARLFGLFGTVLAGDSSLGLIAARNRPQELTLYSVATGNPMGHWTLDSTLLAARIVAKKKQLLALTASQRLYRFDLPAATPATAH